MRSTAILLMIFVGCPGGPTPIPTATGDRNDLDGDGFNQAQDCDDSDPDINPGATDTVGDLIDNDCDGVDGVDADGDGFASEASGGDDCDDADVAFNPGVIDVGWNEIDEDCSGADRHDYKTVGVGDFVSCGVRSTDELTCWGADQFGQVTNTPTGVNWTAVTGGAGWVCAIDDGVIHCWGDDHTGIVTGVPDIAHFTGSGWQQIVAGRDHACAITNLGAATCWGRDDFGQVQGIELLEGIAIEQIAPGKDHTCVILTSGFAQCVGLGDQDQTLPRPPAGRFLQISSGDDHTCGVHLDQTLSCWGADQNGQANPINRTGPYTDLALSADSSCGILSSTDTTCWGQGQFNQIFPPDRTAVQIELGPSHGCARNGVGIVYCWGDNALGQTDVP